LVCISHRRCSFVYLPEYPGKCYSVPQSGKLCNSSRNDRCDSSGILKRYHDFCGGPCITPGRIPNSFPDSVLKRKGAEISPCSLDRWITLSLDFLDYITIVI
jgi:hypothetical protein